MKLLNFDKKTGKLYFKNGVLLGEILCKEDGYYDFWPILNQGYWDAALLHEIANLLDEMNKEWDDEIRRYLDGQ